MAELSAHQQSTVDASEQWFTLDNSPGPIWGSRGREFKSRQPDQYLALSRPISPLRSISISGVQTLMCGRCAGDECRAPIDGTLTDARD